MRLVFSKEAESDLEAIGDYIGVDNPRRALTFIRDLRAAALRLADIPRAFPVLPRYERHGIRRCPHRNYLIFYRIEDNRVLILHILHGARDYEALLFPD